MPRRTVMEKDQSLLESLDPEDAAAYEAVAIVQSWENWSLFHDSVLPGLRIFDRAAIERIKNSYSLRIAPEKRSSGFEGPTVIITGRQDHVVGFQDQIALSAHYTRSTVAVLDRAGHNAHLDQPAITSSVLDEWLVRMGESEARRPT